MSSLFTITSLILVQSIFSPESSFLVTQKWMYRVMDCLNKFLFSGFFQKPCMAIFFFASLKMGGTVLIYKYFPRTELLLQ
ncbi:unnamed protein product [Ceutorhynchus assimilis]|uniref:Uncharacterized protein n=1 Tax=Ceutorhynchus assimilis TaxID=467358 RepID=A0A9N9MEZ4_9CUCU|nr:unnamed protein product [Ceutorhynchus assimilis]